MTQSRRGKGPAARGAPSDDAAGRERSDFADHVGRMVARNPRKIVTVFIVLFLASLPVLYSLSSFLSIYDLLPSGDYYDANEVLNQDLGADNVMFILTTPAGAANVTTTDALREADHIATRFEDVDYVQSTVTLAGLVKVINFLGTGQYELPPDTPEGNAQLEAMFQVALDQFGEDMVYDFVLNREHTAGVGLIIMERGHSLQQYRDWQVELKELGLEMDGQNPWSEATTNEPISIDVIYADLDNVTINEGPLWILAAVIVASISAYSVLNRRVFDTFLALFVLMVAISVTLTVGFLVGVRFTMLSMLLVALILGAGIDYAMHVIARYQEERALGYPVRRAITQSARHVGSALFITTVTTVVGFVSLYFSRIKAIGQFGIMVGAGMLTAYLACILLLPAMLMLHDERKQRRARASGKKADAPAEESLDDAALESRREQLEERLREAQRAGFMGRLAEANQRHPGLIVATFGVLLVLMGSVVWMNGLQLWGASYIEPPILDPESYPMRVLTKLNNSIGIPAEGAIVFEGDMTKPATLSYILAIEEEMTGTFACDDGDGDGQPAAFDDDDPGVCVDPERRDHGILNGMSTASVVKLLYPILGIPSSGQDDQWSVDSDGDGDQDACPASADFQDGCPDSIPDTSAALTRFYDRLYTTPTIQGVMYRVLSDDYDTGTVRYFYNGQPKEGSLGTDVDNYRVAYADLQMAAQSVQEEWQNAGRATPETSPATSVLAIAVEVNDAIDRGNTMSTILMFGTTFVMIFIFWRRTVPTLVTMVPVAVSVGVQYFIIAAFGFEITYVSIILTGMALGIGVDDAVHLVSRFKEEMTAGRSPREAAVLANSEIGKVLVATTVTTLAPFAVIVSSAVIWGANTAWMTIPTLTSALLATIFLLPVVLRWHGERWPQAWVTPRDLKLAGKH